MDGYVFRYAFRETAVAILIILFSVSSIALAGIISIQDSPQNGVVYNSTNNVTLNCTADSEGYVRNVTLYHSMSGQFMANGTEQYGQLYNEEGDVLLLHLDNNSAFGENESHVYDFSGNGNNGTVSGTYNSSGRLLGGMDFGGDESSYLTVNDSASLDLTSGGSIEFWMRPANLAKETYILTKYAGTSGYGLEMYDNGGVRLYFFTGNGMTNDKDGFYSAGSINEGSWSHVVVTWNSTDKMIFINGVSDVDPASVAVLLPAANEENLLIAGTPDYLPCCDYYQGFNGTLDELAIYNRVLSAQEINEHYGRTVENHTGSSWSFHNVPDGSYAWNCLAYDNESQYNWSSQNYTFHVDLHSPPAVRNITLSPSSMDDIDPGMTVNVTAGIDDPSNVSSAVFQWWEDPASKTNASMDHNNVTGLWENASFQTDLIPGVYYYRIWSNETRGFAGFSNTYNVTAAWDYTWNSSPADFGIVQGVVSSSKNIANITINNTGDTPLLISFSDNWPETVTYNGTAEASFLVREKETAAVIVTATFEDDDSIRGITITATASYAGITPEPLTRNVTGALGSYTGGPYIVVSAVNPPANVTQGTYANLSSKAWNIGNETAYNVSLNWTLPAGWTVSSGSQNIDFENITANGARWNNITVYINPPTASAGGSYITASANHSGSTCGQCTALSLVVIECSSSDAVCGLGCSHSTDDDCQPEGGTAGGGSTGTITISSAARTYSLSVTAPGRVDVNRGDEASFLVEVPNLEQKSILSRVSLGMEGFEQTLAKIIPLKTENVGYGERALFNVTLDVPPYYQYGDYNLTLRAEGYFSTNASKNATKAVAEGSVILAVHKWVEGETIDSLQKAREAVSHIRSLGISDARLDSLLEEAEALADSGNFEGSREAADNIMALAQEAAKARDAIKNMQGRIEKAESIPLSIPQSRKFYELAQAAFERGDYGRAMERVTGGMTALQGEEGNVGNIARLGLYYWWLWAAACVIILTTGTVARRVGRRSSLLRKMESLEREEKGILKAREDAMKSRFSGGMSPEEYHKRLLSCEKQMASAGRERGKVLSDMAKSFREPETIFRKELEKLRKSMEAAQRRFYIEKSMGAGEYRMAERELRAGIMEVENNIEMLKAGRRGK